MDDSDGLDKVGMSLESLQVCAGIGVPDTNGLIP